MLIKDCADIILSISASLCHWILLNFWPSCFHCRLTPFIHPSQAYITATGAPTLALPQLPPTPTAAAAGSTTLYPVSPATPTGTGNSLVNYPTFAYPQIIQGYDTSAYPYSALIGYITPNHAAAAAAAGYNPFAASAISPSAASGSASFGQLIPTMHCFQPQQILQERLQWWDAGGWCWGGGEGRGGRGGGQSRRCYIL